MEIRREIVLEDTIRTVTLYGKLFRVSRCRSGDTWIFTCDEYDNNEDCWFQRHVWSVG